MQSAERLKKIWGFGKKRNPVKKADVEKSYRRAPSLAERLAFQEYSPQHQCFLLEDGVSVASVYELEDVPSEARPDEVLNEMRDRFQRLFQDTIPQEAASPWILQFYLQDEESLMSFYEAVADYVKPLAKDSQLTTEYLKVFEEHCKLMANKKGLFRDLEVSGNVFKGKVRRVRMVVYRRITSQVKLRRGRSVVQELHAVSRMIVQQLEGAGVKVKAYAGKEFYEWMKRWFNPAPPYTQGDVDALLKVNPYPGDDNMPFGYDYAEQLFCSVPESHHEKGLWYFDGKPHKFITVEALSSIPVVGHLSAEREQGRKFAALFDKFPAGSIFMMTVVIRHQEDVKNDIDTIEDSCAGDNAESNLTREACIRAKEEIEEGNYLFPVAMGVYIRAENDDELYDREIEVETLLVNNGLKPIKGEYELTPCDSYFRYLPMCYDYQFDKENTKRSTYVYARQIANLVPLYGRYRGTGNPAVPFWNRGGEPLVFDPFSKLDKSFNSHLLFLGVTGSGKSASLVYLMLHIMAIYKPRLFIIEAGNSFGLLADYFEKKGLSVNQVTLKASSPTPLNPFADALKLLDKIEAEDIEQTEEDLAETVEALNQAADEDDLSSDIDSERDYLGEMALACQLMVTGGERKEQDKVSRQDRHSIIEAILDAIKFVASAGRDEVIAEDIVAAFERLAEKTANEAKDTEKARRIREMADGMKTFCTDIVSSSFFNRKGDPWPLSDVTRLDMGLMKDEGYEAQLALAFMGIMSRILAIAEATQYDERMTIVLVDESHIITKNPLTAAVITKISKMSRKLGLWLWFATQNMDDFPDESRKMLTMLEFWICLGTSEAELDAIKRFKNFTDEEKKLFLSVRKEIPKYVEGVILSSRVNGLFRNVPPRLALALGMTEKDEKTERRKLMKQYGINEIEAAEMIASDMIKRLSHVED